MNQKELLKLGSKPMIIAIILAFTTFFLGFMAIAVGDMAEAGEEVIGRGPKPGKLHIYPYATITMQVIVYAVLFFLPGFLVSSACYPRLPLPERFVLSILFATLMYATYVNLFAVTGNVTFFARSQIIWDLLYVIVTSLVAFPIWRLKLSKIK